MPIPILPARNAWFVRAFLSLAVLAGCTSSEESSDVVFQTSGDDGIDSARVAMSGAGRGLVVFQFASESGLEILGADYSVDAGLGAVLPTGGQVFASWVPQLVMDASGRATIFERGGEFTCARPGPGTSRSTLESRDYDPGSGWTSPQVVAEDIRPCDLFHIAFLERDLTVDAAGNALALWVIQGSDYEVPNNLFASQRPAGGTWSTPIQLNGPLSGAREVAEPRIAINAAGDALVAYVVQDKASSVPGELFTHTFSFTAGFGPAVQLDDDANVGTADIAIDGAGNGLAVWSDHAGFESPALLRSRRYVFAAGWTFERRVVGETQGYFPLRVVLDRAGDGMVVFRHGPPSDASLVAVPYRDGTWLDAHRFTVAQDAVSNFALAIAPEGDATVVLSQRGRTVDAFDRSDSSVASRRFLNDEFDPGFVGSGWQDLTTIEAPIFRVQNADPDIAMESRDSAIAVWTSRNDAFSDAQIRTFIWAPPLAAFTTIADRLALSVDGATSRARTTDSRIVQYQWDFENDGVFDATGVQAQRAYAIAGTYEVRLQVTDGEGIVAETTRTVTVSTDPPPPGPTFTLNVTATSGSGAGRVVSNPAGIDCALGNTDCTEQFAAGSVVTLTPTPNPGSRFDVWQGDADCSDANVTMNADKLCEAIFVTDGGGGTTFALTILNVVGGGRVETADARIRCPGGACTASYAPGAIVQVNAVPDPGVVLEDWGGDCNPFGALPTFSVPMERDITCTATFATR